jgi:uncharacterized DUF497 family protein
MNPASIQHFSWDNAKARANERKHGITFQLAATVFRNRLSVICHDGRHDSAHEDRWHVVGVAEGGTLIVVVCTFDEANDNEHVRIISARRATTRERREYECGEYTVREPTASEEYNVTQDIEPEDDSDMEAEYDFSKGVRGKFAHWRLPVYVENSILGYFHDRSIATGIPGDTLINEVLRQHVAAAGYVPRVFKERS